MQCVRLLCDVICYSLIFCKAHDIFLINSQIHQSKRSKYVFPVHGQGQSHGQAPGVDDQPLRVAGSSYNAADVWQRRQRAHGEIW